MNATMRVCRGAILTFAVLFIATVVTAAAQSRAFLVDREWFLPASADPRAPGMTFGFPQWSDAFEFSLEPGRRFVWDVSVGQEIPIFVIESVPGFPAAGAKKGDWGLGVWVAISFHVIEDMWKDPSNPIVNTDYRFSLATLKYRRAMRVSPKTVTDADYLDVKWDVYHHESTHLGDEFVIGAIREFPQFERINVSYEFYDVAAGWEAHRPGPKGGMRRWTVRGGLLGVWPKSQGYYSDHTLDVDSRVIARSKRNLEPYVQAEYWSPHGRRSDDPSLNKRWAPFTSVDARYKTIYNYLKLSDDEPEDKQWSVNLLAGIRTERRTSLLSVKEVYARFYHGVNPAGQLRNQRDYTVFGLGVSFAVGSRP